MNTIDIIICALLIIGAVKGFINGFFLEVATFIGLVAGIYCSIYFSHLAINFLNNRFNLPVKYISITSFAIIFITILLATIILAKLLTKFTSFVRLGILNKALGALFGILKYTLILCVIIFFLNKFKPIFPFLYKPIIQESILYNKLDKLTSYTFPKFKEHWENFKFKKR